MKNDIGRNEPCPCGSGLKFKKCCINKTPTPSPKYKMMRCCHWSQDEIREMPTEQIIGQLETWGIRFNKDEFLKDVNACYGAYDIYKQWEKRFVITAEGFDVDFAWMACEVLWERLSPQKLSTEQIDDMMQEGYTLIENKDGKGGCRLWLKAWEELRPRFTDEMKSIKDAEPVFRGTQLLFNWCQDVEMELGIAGRDDKTFHEHRIRYCREFCKAFPETGSDIIPHMRIAIGESLYKTGKKEESDREFQSLINDDPDNTWNYVRWGDVYAGFHGDDYIDKQRAEELYTKALGLDPEEDETIRERIEDLKKK